MGLESFETEGPRKRSKSKSKSGRSGGEDSGRDIPIVHYLEEEGKPEISEGERRTAHQIEVREDIYGNDRYVCQVCTSVATSPETIKKVDKLKNRKFN